MNRTVAAVILGLTVMFAGSASAADKFADGAIVKISKFQPNTNEDVSFALRKQGEDKQGDGIYHLECTDSVAAKKGEYLVRDKAKEGSFVAYGEKPTQWILHKNSSGWSIILKEDGALAVSQNGKKHELQRNQGAKHQVWQIKE